MMKWLFIFACIITFKISAQNALIDAEMYVPMRDASGVYLAKGSLKNKGKAIKVQAIDFKNSTNYFYVVKNNDLYGLIDLFGNQETPGTRLIFLNRLKV